MRVYPLGPTGFKICLGPENLYRIVEALKKSDDPMSKLLAMRIMHEALRAEGRRTLLSIPLSALSVMEVQSQ